MFPQLLSTDNLLITPTGHIKLTDFGLSHIGLIERQSADKEGASSLFSLPGMMPFNDEQNARPIPKERGTRVVGVRLSLHSFAHSFTRSELT